MHPEFSELRIELCFDFIFYANLIQVHFVYHSYSAQISKGTWQDIDSC